MRGIFVAFVAVAGLAGPGCMTVAQDTGHYWRFECGRAGVIQSPTVYTQGSGPVSMGGMMTVPATAAAATTVSAPRLAMTATGPDCGPCQPAAPARSGGGPTLAEMAGGNGCTLDDLCRDVTWLRQHMAQMQREALPMPKAGP